MRVFPPRIPNVPQIMEQLSADQLARHAFNVFVFAGRQPSGGRLIYRALELDPHNVQALRCLSDFLNAPGTEAFSGAVLEYALSPAVSPDEASRQMLDDLRFIAKWSWGLARHKSGKVQLAHEDFADRSAFEVDEAGYLGLLDRVLVPAGSLDAAFRAAHTLCGGMAGLLAHPHMGGKAGLKEALHPEQFIKTNMHDAWLRSNTMELDELEAQRQAIQ